jgi:flagellar hook-associated protein 2
MTAIQFGGVVSGLNTQSIIDAMVAVEKQPLTNLQTKESTLTTQKAAYAQLGSAMDDLIAKVKNFTVSSAGASRAATTSDSSILTAIAGTSAAVASYQVSVARLATATAATSTAAIGAVVTGTVNTALTLGKANLAVPITAGNMALTVDGTTVPVAVGDPSTTTLQSILDGLTGALKTQLQATDPTADVSASIVGGKLQLAVSGTTTTHDISIGNRIVGGDTSNLATALGLPQALTGVGDTMIAGSAYLDPTLASLNFAGNVTAGQISAIVDGTLVHYTIGDPTKTTLKQVMDGFGQAIQDQLRAGGTDSGATMTVSVAGNRLQLAVSGAVNPHTLSFGAASDASNALGIFGIDSSTSSGLNQTIAGTTNLGVTRTISTLDTAGLTGLVSNTTGTMTINGVAITYDTTADSLSTIISRINNSSAGVIASVDRTNDKVLLTRKDTGAVAIDITDTGTLATALKLAPGTTNAQTIGVTAQVTVDGRTIISASNTVSNAIDGVALTLVKKDPTGQVETLNVGVDQTAVAAGLNAFISSFNNLGDQLDSLTASTPGTKGGTAGTAGPLADDPTALTMFLDLRQSVMQTVGSGLINSLGAIGVNTGSYGAAVGTTNRLQLDTTKLASALASDPNTVANLLDKSTGPFGTLVTQLQNYEDPSNTYAYIQAHTAGLTSDITDVKSREDAQQTIIDNYTTMIEAQFTAMETTLSLLQSQSAQLSAQLGQTTTSSGSGLSSSSTGG